MLYHLFVLMMNLLLSKILFDGNDFFFFFLTLAVKKYLAGPQMDDSAWSQECLEPIIFSIGFTKTWCSVYDGAWKSVIVFSLSL